MTAASTLTVLDVGHGSCTVIQDSGQIALIDTGPGGSVLEYLLQQGINIINLVVVSHADEDHIGGIVALLGATEFHVERVVLNSDGAKASAMWRNLSWEVDQLRRSGTVDLDLQLREGDTLLFGSPAITLEVLAPRDHLAMLGPGSRDANNQRITTNTISAVVLVRRDGYPAALLTGDLDSVGLEHLLETQADVRAPLLVFPHHGGLAGGGSSAARAFAERLTAAVAPRNVVISLGRNRFSNPRPAIVDGVRSVDADIRVACTQLSVLCAPTLPAIGSASHLLDLHARGSANGSCCAGTMRVTFPAVGAVFPDAESHGNFIDSCAPTAVCRRAL